MFYFYIVKQLITKFIFLSDWLRQIRVEIVSTAF